MIVIILIIFASLIGEKKDNAEKTVFVIILDGFSSEYLNKTPYLKSLAEQWLANTSAVTVMPSITPAAHASMFTGVNADIHGIKNYEVRALKKPTIITFLKGKGVKTCVLVGKITLEFLLQEADYSVDTTLVGVDKGSSFEIDIKTLEKVVSLYEQGKCQLFVINLPATDIIGHEYGPLSNEMNSQLANLDDLLHEFLLKIGEATVILTADHGMCTNSKGQGYHGTNESCAMNVPIIVKSKILVNESLSSVKDVHMLIETLYT